MLKKLHSGVEVTIELRDQWEYLCELCHKKNSKHIIKMCGKVIATAQKGYGIQDHRKFITGLLDAEFWFVLGFFF